MQTHYDTHVMMCLYIHKVIITYYVLHCLEYYYIKMTIDIHSILGKNPITRNVLKQKFGYRYCGPYNNLNKQVDYNKTTGRIYKIHDKPKNKTDEICMKHDICYSIGKNKNICDKDMIN